MILFTAAHHAREALSLSMIFKIFLTKVSEVISSSQKNKKTIFWSFNNILFVPAVNVDGVTKIDEGFHLHGSWSNKMVRKNLRKTGRGKYCI